MMLKLLTFLCIVGSSTTFAQTETEKPDSLNEIDFQYYLSDEFINEINRHQSSWKAGRNFPPESSEEYLKGLMGTKLFDANDTTPYKSLPVGGDNLAEILAFLPESFDSRTKWPHCQTIGEIRDQGSCGSCWAFAATSVMADRICIKSGQTKNEELSAENLLSCCYQCGNGCRGGSLAESWRYYIKAGIVSGGGYHSEIGCRPYSIPQCSHYFSLFDNLPRCKGILPTPKCKKRCRSNYGKSFAQDKHYGSTYYRLQNNEALIRYEILTNGPVQTAFLVYHDFFSYKSGVYYTRNHRKVSGHSVKIIGWGEENGYPYWLCVNSWNSHWGDKGLFKIIRGYNHLGIESNVIAGEPLLN